MSERLPAPEHDPRIDEAAVNIAANLERVMKHYQVFVADEGELALAVYKPAQNGVYEPSMLHNLHLTRELDLTDNPATAETLNYHIWIDNNRTSTTSVDVRLSVHLGSGQPPTATVVKGSLHSIDNVLQNFVEAKGL